MTRPLIRTLAVVAALVILAAGGYVVVRSRAGGSGTGQPAASPSPRVTSVATASPTPVPRWQVAKAVASVVAYARPSTSAPVKGRFGKVNANQYPSVFLVRETRQVAGVTWYQVWLPIRPNESRGWIKEGSVAIYTTSARIEIDLSARKLTVTRRGQVVGTFPIAVGTAQLPTPTGIFYVNQKLRPSAPGGPFGVLAIGISAFQMKLAASAWAQGGPVAIHGTNQDQLIGQAVSHGCIRMHNADVLKVNDWVPTGSPVVIHK